MGIILAPGWWGDFVGWLEGHEASALVLAAFLTFLATVILAVVTAFYAGSARRQARASGGMVGEMQRQRLMGVQPIAVPSAELVGEWEIQARVVNVGNGPSFDLLVSLESADKAREVDEAHSVQVLKPGDEHLVRFEARHVFEEKWDRDLEENVHVFPLGKYRLVAAYRDLYGNPLSAIRPFEVVELVTERGTERGWDFGNIQFSGYEIQPGEETGP